MSIACRVTATSCTRSICAPRATARIATATEAPRRSLASASGSTSFKNDFRLAPTATGTAEIRDELVQSLDELRAVTRVLRESEAGIHHESIGVDAGFFHPFGGVFPFATHVEDDIAVRVLFRDRKSRHFLHGSTRMHQHVAGVGFGCSAREIGVRGARNVVHDGGACRETRTRDLRRLRVDRNTSGPIDERARVDGVSDHVDHATELLLRRHRLRSRACRFTADVDDVRAFAEQQVDASARVVGLQKCAAVGERVRRHVAHAHESDAAFRHRSPKYGQERLASAAQDRPSPPMLEPRGDHACRHRR